MGRGEIEVAGCVCKRVPDSFWRLLTLAKFAIDGTWPEAGGTHDQCGAFVDLVRQIKSDDEHWKAKLTASAARSGPGAGK